MPCYSPLTAYKTAAGDVVFNELARHGSTTQLTLPCGQCIGCRLERSRQWAMRCMHEASLYKQNSFVTLTYANDKIPQHGTLKYADFQKFMKRLRKHADGTTVRFYMCGEYGDTTSRPHYHACLFNWDWEDKTHWSRNQNGDNLYQSETLTKLWGHGHALTGDVTFESAAYVARYVMKKVTGKNAEDHYGERTPEFNKMSLKPGVGANWLEQWKKDVYPHDYVVINGVETKPPKYYDQILKRNEREKYEEIKERREEQAYKNRLDNTPERLNAKMQVAKAKIRQLIRTEI